MDVITHLLFGNPFGYVRTQSDVQVVAADTKETCSRGGNSAIPGDLFTASLHLLHTLGQENFAESPGQTWHWPSNGS